MLFVIDARFIFLLTTNVRQWVTRDYVFKLRFREGQMESYSDDGSLSRLPFLSKGWKEFISFRERWRSSEAIVVNWTNCHPLRAEGLAPPFDPFSIETRQLLTFRHRFEGFIDRDRPVAGSKSTGRMEKKTKERGKKLRTFFKVGKGRNKNLWTWLPEMSQLNNREIKVCTDYLYRFLRDDRFFFFFRRIGWFQASRRESIFMTRFITIEIGRTVGWWGIDVVKSNARLFNGRTTPFVRPRHESRIFQDTTTRFNRSMLHWSFDRHPIVTCNCRCRNSLEHYFQLFES